MKVSALQLFLRSLGAAVTAADGGWSLPADLEALSAGLQPFAALDVSQFSAFLRQAEQYRQSGAVAMPLAGPAAEQVQENLRKAALLCDKIGRVNDFDKDHLIAEWTGTRRDLEQALTAFLMPLALTVKVMGNEKNLRAILQKNQVRRLVLQVRTALAGVTDEASLDAPDRQEKLAAVTDRLQDTELKALASELGTTARGGRGALLGAIIERITGVKASTKTAKATSKASAIDQMAVQQHAIKLKELLEKSLDPGRFSNLELESAITELQSRSIPELKAIAKEIGLDRVGTTKNGILNKVRAKLREVERARESLEV
jgi:hypothetical protein